MIIRFWLLGIFLSLGLDSASLKTCLESQKKVTDLFGYYPDPVYPLKNTYDFLSKEQLIKIADTYRNRFDDMQAFQKALSDVFEKNGVKLSWEGPFLNLDLTNSTIDQGPLKILRKYQIENPDLKISFNYSPQDFGAALVISDNFDPSQLMFPGEDLFSSLVDLPLPQTFKHELRHVNFKLRPTYSTYTTLFEHPSKMLYTNGSVSMEEIYNFAFDLKNQISQMGTVKFSDPAKVLQSAEMNYKFAVESTLHLQFINKSALIEIEHYLSFLKNTSQLDQSLKATKIKDGTYVVEFIVEDGRVMKFPKRFSSPPSIDEMLATSRHRLKKLKQLIVDIEAPLLKLMSELIGHEQALQIMNQRDLAFIHKDINVLRTTSQMVDVTDSKRKKMLKHAHEIRKIVESLKD